MGPRASIESLESLSAIRGELSPADRAEWERLADAGQALPWQRPALVLSWYEACDPELTPFLLVGRRPDGRLAGVLPLALRRGVDPMPVFPGAELEGCAGWVSANAQDFLPHCLLMLRRRRLLPRQWTWPRLAPGLDLGWARHPELRALGITARRREVSRAVLDLDALAPGDGRPDIDLVRLDGNHLPDELMRRLTCLSDMQQLAREGETTFSGRPRRAEFLRLLLARAPEAALCFVHMREACPAGFVYVLVDRDRAVCAAAAVDPRKGLAPPAARLVQAVARRLRAQGVRQLDLAGARGLGESPPGRAQAFFEVCIYPSRADARWQELAARMARGAASAGRLVGVGPAGTGRLGERLRLLRGRAPGELAGVLRRAVRRWLWSEESVLVFCLDRPGSAPPSLNGGRAIREDALEDFLLYTGSNRYVTRQRQMASAIRSFNEGEHCYTVVEDGTLVHYRWFRPFGDAIHISEVGVDYPLPPASGVAYDAYTEPAARGRGLQKLGLDHELRAAFTAGVERAYNVSVEDNEPSRRNIEKAGYRPIARITRVTRLGRRRVRTQPLA